MHVCRYVWERLKWQQPWICLSKNHNNNNNNTINHSSSSNLRRELSHLKRESPISNWVPCAPRIGKRSIYFPRLQKSSSSSRRLHPSTLNCTHDDHLRSQFISFHPWKRCGPYLILYDACYSSLQIVRCPRRHHHHHHPHLILLPTATTIRPPFLYCRATPIPWARA